MKTIRNFFSRFRLRNVNLYQRLKLHRFQMPAIILLSVAFLAISNVLVSQLSYRFDFSQGKAYTLSESTKNILRALDENVTISLISSSQLPTRLQPVEREVKDFLKEFERVGGSVSVEILDANKDEKAVEKANNAGLQQIQFSQLSQDDYQVSQSYFGIIITYGEKTDILEQIGDINNLEYNIASSIYSLSSETVPKIAFLGVERSILPQQDPLQILSDVLNKQFEVTYISAPVFEDEDQSESFTIDDETKAVLLFALNNRTYSEEEISELQAYVSQGGNLIVFADGVYVHDDLSTTEVFHNLSDFLSSYGLHLETNLLLSANAEIVNFGDSQTSFFTSYPFWIKTNNIWSDAPYFSNAGQFTFPWASSISLNNESDQTLIPLIRTTPQSWQQKEDFDVSPTNISNPNPDELMEFVISAESSRKGRGSVLLVGSSRFALDQYLSRNSSNVNYLLNVLNNYASDGVLSSIRQRAVTIYPLPSLSSKGEDMFKYANILFLPGIFGLLGGIRLWKRSRK